MSVLGGIATQIGTAAQVLAKFTPITPTDNEAKFRIQGDDGNWEDWFVRNSYPSDYHRYHLALTSPNGFQGASSVVVQLAAPTSDWVCEWSCEKIVTVGQYPVYPDPRPTDTNIVLLDLNTITEMIKLKADGISPLYRISGTYFYAYKDPLKAVLYHGRPPWMDQSVPMSVVNSQKRRGIIAEKY